MLDRNDIFKLRELKDKLYLRSSLVQVQDPESLLGINENFSSDQVLAEIIERSADFFDERLPFSRFQRFDPRVAIRNRNTEVLCHEFVSNFDEFAAGNVEYEDLTMIPRAIISVGDIIINRRGGEWEYQAPNLKLRSPNLFGSGRRSINAYFDRPLVINYTDTDKTFTEDSALYFLSRNRRRVFIDYCLIGLLTFIRDQRDNYQHPNLPFNLFGGIDQNISSLESSVTEYLDGTLYSELYDFNG